ncbi:MAG: hypothetical protein Q7S61_06310 [bacterium]|nr:hypothetical protein [bacterium]
MFSSLRIRIGIALLISFLLATYLNNAIFMPNTPLVKAEAQVELLKLPQQLQISTVDLLTRLTTRTNTPPEPTSSGKSGGGTSRFPTDKTNRQYPTTTPRPGQNSPLPTATPIVYPTATPMTPQTVTRAQFAQCLTIRGMKMYGAENCNACDSQKDMFGSDFSYITYIDCLRQSSVCNQKGVKTYPTWEDSTGKLYVGYRPFSNLAQISTCAAPTN